MSNSRSKKMLSQIASNASNNSNITVNDPDNSEILDEYEMIVLI